MYWPTETGRSVSPATAQLPELLRGNALFDSLQLTQEDRERTNMVRSETGRVQMASEVRGGAGQPDADEAHRVGGQRPRRDHGHDLGGGTVAGRQTGHQVDP